MSDSTLPPGAPPAAPSRSPRRWLRRTLIGLAAVALLLFAAFWYLGRESTFQLLLKKAADASGGELTVNGASGTLYGRMHLDHLSFRSPTQHLDATNIDIDWSPFQYLSRGVLINRLQVAALSTESLGPPTPTVLPDSLQLPVTIQVDDARLGKLTLLSKGGSTVIDNLRLKLSVDRNRWQVRDASASTPFGLVAANATLGASRPFVIDGQASLVQNLTAQQQAARQQPAQASALVKGNLSLLDIDAKGSSQGASADARLQLAPFDPIILRNANINGSGIDPSRVNAAWPQADLRLQLNAAIDAKQNISGALALDNQGLTGPLDQQRLPLHGISAQLGGTLTATRITAAVIDLAAAGKFSGGGTVQRSAPDAGIGSASFKLHTDRIDLKAIQSTLKQTKIAGDISVSTTADTQTFSALLADNGLKLDLQATLADALLKVQHARLLAGKGSVEVTGQASLKDKQPFQAKASASHFNPAAFGAYPAADINLDLNASGQVSPAWQVAADFALRPSRLFDQALTGKGKLHADATHFSNIDAALALGQNRLALNGDFGAPGERLKWSVEAPQLSAARSDLSGAVSANGVLEGSMAAPRSSFAFDAKGLGLVAASGGLVNKRAPADSLLHASGEVVLAGPGKAAEVKLSGAAQRFNPAAFGAYPSGSISADFNGNGRLGSDWQVALNLDLQPSTLSNAPLSGYAKVLADARHVENADVDLHLGPNSVQARGKFGAAGDQLNWKIDAPQLSSLGPQFGGAVNGSGVLSGSSAAPALSMKLDGKDLRLFGEQQIKLVRASASLGAGRGADDPLVSDIEITGYSMPGFALAGARLQTGGTRAAHTLQLSAHNDDFDASAAVKGGWNDGAWSGTLDSLQNKGRFAVTLQAPMPLRLAGPAGSGVAGLLHPEQISLSNAVLKLPGGSLSVQSVEKNGPHWRSAGKAAGVPLNYLAQFSPVWRDNTSSDLTLGADWSLDLQAAAASASAPAMTGMLHVYREKGDITVGTDTPMALGLRTLDARVDVLNNTLRLQVGLDGARAGQVRVDASTQLAQGRIADDSGLTLAGSADMPSIAWLAPFSGVSGLQLDGALKVALNGAGTIAKPTLTGQIGGDKLVVNWAEQGIKLVNGQLQAALAGDQLQVQRLSFDGTEGKVQTDGWVRFANGEASLQLKLVADKLLLLSRPDRTLVVSGETTLVRDAKRFQLDGKFKAERALIELASQDTPTLSDDVVVLGKAGTSAAANTRAAAPSLPLNINVEADLGQDFKLRGKGLDAMLEGSVTARVQDRRPLRVNGGIRVVSGTYAAYGQKLSIERGLLNFTGAYDNPGLNILAVRKRPDGEALTDTNVEAGVEVRGTALAPTAKLVSTPTVPDSDKLAWLVLGHGAEGTGSDEMGILSTAAGALFGGAGSGGGIQSRLANSLGLDEVGLGQSSGAGSTSTAANGTQAKGLESTVVTVGKRLSQRAYLSFEQGTSTATSLVKLRYKLNQRISLQFQTGVNSAFDVLYTWAFD